MSHIFSVASENRKTFLLLFLLTAIGAFIRIYGLGEWYYYSDEMWHVYVARQPGLRYVFDTNLMVDGHAPLPYFIWHYLLLLWDNPWMARLPSLISGIFLIPLGYMAGERLFKDRNFGLFAAFFFAFSSIFVLQSQVVRGYTLMMMFAVLAIWSIACYRDCPRARYLIGYFFSIFGAVLSEFAIAPLAPLLALALLYVILKHHGNRADRIVIFTLMHLLLLAFMLWFCHQLETVGHFRNTALLGPGNHLLSLNTIISIFSNLIASLIYANMVLPLSLYTNLIPAITMTVWILLIWMGFVECIRLRAWIYPGIALIFAATTLLLYVLNLLPLDMPRRNIGYTLVLMPIVFVSLHTLVSHPLLARLRLNQTKIIIIALTLCTLPYIITGDRYRKFFDEEFQVSLKDRSALLAHLKQYAKPGDIIVTDWLSDLYFQEINPQTPVSISSGTARYDGYRLPIYYAQMDYRTDPFALTPYDVSEMLKAINSAGGLAKVKLVWFVTIDDTYIRNHTVSSRHLLLLHKIFATNYENRKFKDRLSVYAIQQQHVADAVRTALPQQAFTTVIPPPCIEKKNRDCLSIIAIPVPIETISKLFLSGIRYEDLREIYYETKGIPKF